MKKAYLTKFFGIIFIMSIMLSCKKEHGNLSHTENDKIYEIDVVHSRLNFNNVEEFNRIVDHMHLLSESEKLSTFVEEKTEMKNFVSLAEKGQKQHNKSLSMSLVTTGINDISENDTLVEDPVFANLLNENREIKVGETIYKVTPYGTFLATEDTMPAVNL